ncbi:MAG: hypothetical protein RBG13Loki_1357 [Promethearchaeota archaeon CR_4]|nr:MAG: hypothetical protein RBG13Loki_1357 [Candidatus Lokiarchaeota archaeon CR_4]
MGAIIGLLYPKRQSAAVLLQFFGLSLELVFLVDYIVGNLQFVYNVQTGFYCLLIGISIIFLNIIRALLAKHERDS